MAQVESKTEFDILISPGRFQKEYWKDLWRYRELVLFLSWRDISVRYKQAFFGVAWAVVRPLLTMVIFTLVFGRVAKLPSQGIPYSLLVFSGMLPWQLLSTSVGESAESILANANMISKVYFPRSIIPLSSIFVCLFDFLIGFFFFLGYMVVLHHSIPYTVIYIPFIDLLDILLAAGVGLFLSSLNVRYRDFRYVLPFLLQLGLYLSPVGYSGTIVPLRYQWAYILNPVVGVIDGFRWCLFGIPMLPGSLMASICFCLLSLAIGFSYFRSTERSFADII
jgi:lipopolysaccharide transport system permease protein